VDGNDVSNAKPDPEVFIQGAKKVNFSNEECIVFEDSVAGIQAANIAGMTSVGIGEESILHEAQFVFPDFTHIDLNFIQNLINK
jgi:beta-phosphoglucomutase